MKKVNNLIRLQNYQNQYGMKDIFTKDMTEYMELLFYKKNEYIVKESEIMKYLLFIVEGKAKVFTTLSNGKSLLLCFYQGFKVLGDLEIIDVQCAVTNIQAIADTYCIGISYTNARKYLLEDAKFLRYICSSLGNKLNRCSKNSSINLLYPLENRLASYVYTTGERIKNKEKERIRFNENLTEIAELLGSSYRHLLRTLNALCEKGILIKQEGFYEVEKEDVLIRMSADLYK